MKTGLYKQLQAKEDKNASLRKSNEYYKRRCMILEEIIRDNLPEMRIPCGSSQQENFFRLYLAKRSNTEEKTSKEITTKELFLMEIQKNFYLEPNIHRYGEKFWMFSFVLYCLGSKLYCYLRSVFPFPSKSSLLRRYESRIYDMIEQLEKGYNGIERICMFFKRKYEIHEHIDAIIGIDAISIEPDLNFPGTIESPINNIFMLYLMPISVKYKSIPVMLIPHSKGNADNYIKETISNAIKYLRYNGFNIKYKATDGDSGYNEWNKSTISKWWKTYLKNGIEESLCFVKCEEEWPIADMLHIFKNARSRIINGRVSVRIDGKNSFDARDLESILHLGDALLDNSPKGKMKDFYCIEIFRMDNFFTLMNQKYYSAALYILPYILWGEVIRNPSYTPQLRLDLLTLVLDIFAYFKSQIKDLNNGVTQYKTKNSIQYFASETCLDRSLNTILAIIYEMRIRSDDIALDRFGTHILECSFGRVRLLCQNKHTRKQVFKSFYRLELLDEFTHDLELPIAIRNRVNVGGVKLTGSIKEKIYVQRPNIDNHCFIKGMQVLIEKQVDRFSPIDNGTYEEASNDVDVFVDWMMKMNSAWLEEGEPLEKVCKGSPVSNHGILDRLIAFGSKK